MSEQPLVPFSDPRLVEFIGTHLADRDSDDAFLVLSDEEVIAIDRTMEPDEVILPWALDQQDLDVTAFARFGERSLVLRGLVTIDVSATPDEQSVRSTTAEILDMAISARRSGAAIMRFVTMTGEAAVGLVVTVQPRHGVVIEEVGPEGFHYFTALGYNEALDRIVDRLIPEDTQPATGAALTIDESAWPAWCRNELGMQAHVVEADSYLADTSGDMRSENWLIASGDGLSVHVERDDTGRLRIAMTDRPTARQRLRALLDEALENAPRA